MFSNFYFYFCLHAELKMTPINHWFAMVKEMMKSSLAPNVMFGFLLVCLEKFMEMEFECPCDPQLNVWLVTGCFCVPAIFIIVVMSSQGYKNRKCSEGWTEKVFIGFAQAILWLTLLFMDGNYLACAMTESSGEYVKAHEDASWKWCKPKNSTELVNTKKWFAVSKVRTNQMSLQRQLKQLCLTFFRN